MKIIDAFCFFNELDILELRLRILDPYVDHFVIVEADHTFSGKPKESVFLKNQKRFDEFAGKITHHFVRIDAGKLDFTSRPEKFDLSTDFWKVEFMQRNAVAEVLRSFESEDLAIVSDVDEFPAPQAIYEIRNSAWRRFFIKNFPFVFQQEEFYYNVGNLRVSPWHGSIIASCRKFIELSPQKLRDRRNKIFKIKKGGYHFSYFMTPEQISLKISSFAHQELNTEENRSEERIAGCVGSGEDLFGRQVNTVSVDLNHFPEEIRTQLVKYPLFCGAGFLGRQ